jgi:hypothetical protein
MLSPSILAEREPERPESPGEHAAPPRPNPTGSEEYGFSRGMKPLGRRSEAEKFRKKARKRKGRKETPSRSRKRKKALKGKTQECWKLKEVSKDGMSGNRYEGSQTLKAELPKGSASLSDASEGAKKGLFHPEMLKGKKAYARCPWLRLGFEPGRNKSGNLERKTLKVAPKRRRDITESGSFQRSR